jgi:hypothetical protein
MDEAEAERSLELGVILLEVLRLLNQAEEEESTVGGLEHHELFTLLRRGPMQPSRWRSWTTRSPPSWGTA